MADWKIWTTNRSERKVVNVQTLTGQVEMKVPARYKIMLRGKAIQGLRVEIPK